MKPHPAKIALVSEHASPLAPPGAVDSGGQNVYVAHVARALAARGMTVDIFTRRDAPGLPPVLQWQPGLRVVHVPAGPARAVPKEQLLPHMDEFSRNLRAFAQRQRRHYDVVHANFFMSGWAGLTAARALDLPLVMTFHALGRVRQRHQGAADAFPPERCAIEERLLREAERTIAECPQDRADLLTLYRGDPRRIDVVPCGFDPAEFPPLTRDEARRRLGWDPREFVVLQLGRLVPRKGIDTVIRALALARRWLGRARLYVVGGNSPHPDPRLTPEIGRLLGVARDAGVEHCVGFTGRRERGELGLYYRAADVFVTVPWYEPFGITPLEAMACGTPVVGADVGGIRHTVVDGVTGFRVPPQSPAALAERLLQLHDDAALRARLGDAGRRRAYRFFTWRRVAGDVAAVYARAVRGRAAPAWPAMNREAVA